MDVLVDTHAFLWIITESKSLSERARQVFLDDKSRLHLSIASIWEIAIKHKLGKLSLHQSLEVFIPQQLQKNNIDVLDISMGHVLKTTTLPFHHRDPFDRLLIAQALSENWSVLSADEVFDQYSVTRVW